MLYEPHHQTACFLMVSYNTSLGWWVRPPSQQVLYQFGGNDWQARSQGCCSKGSGQLRTGLTETLQSFIKEIYENLMKQVQIQICRNPWRENGKKSNWVVLNGAQCQGKQQYACTAMQEVFHQEHEEALLYCVGDQALSQVAQGSCGASFLGGIRKLSGCSLGQVDAGCPALVVQNEAWKSLPTSTVLWFWETSEVPFSLHSSVISYH